jgi:hypothetical protein
LYDSRKEYAEYGPDGWRDGRCVCRWAGGDTGYYLYERGELGRGRATGPGAVLGFIMYTRGEPKARARVCADGSCWYNYEDCAPDDPRLLALIEQVAPVEVHPAVPAPHPQSPATRPPSNRPTRRLGLHPQALADAMATEVHAHSARRRRWPSDTSQQQPHCKARLTRVRAGST